MNDKDKSSQRKNTRSKNGRSVKRTGSAARSPKTSAAAHLEARFRAVFESSQAALGVSKAGVHVYVNPAYRELFGYPPKTDLSKKPVLDLIAPGSRDQIKEYIARRARGESAPSTYETRGLRVDGSEFEMAVTVSRYQENGDDYALAILRDITPRKTAEAEVAERGAMLQQIMDTASVAIFLVDKDGRIINANRRMAEMFRCAMGELIGSEYVDHVHPSERETGREKMLALLKSTIPSVDLERLYRRKDGTEFWGHLAGRRFHDIHGNELGLIGVITDITARKQSELDLKQSEAKYRRLYNETPILLQSIDREGILVEVNDYWLETLGYERGEVIGRNVTDFFTDASRTYAQEVAMPSFFRDGIIKDVSYQLVKRNGDIVTVLLSATGERDADGNVVRSQAVIQDVTERRRMEDALRQSEEKYKLLIEATNTGFVIISDQGRVLDANQEYVRMTGHDRLEEILGRSVSDWTAPHDLERNAAEVRKCMETGSVRNLVIDYIDAQGRTTPIELNATVLRGPVSARIITVCREISQRMREEERKREYAANLQRLLSVTREMTATTDIPRLYRVAVQTAKDLLSFDFSTIMLLSGDGAGLNIVDTIGFPVSMVGDFHLVEGQGLATYVIKCKQPDAVPDFLDETRFEVPPIVRELSIRSALCVPMMIEEGVFGVLIGHTFAVRTFTSEDVALYQSIGNQAAIAIRHAMNTHALAKSENMLQTIIDTEPECVKVLDANANLIMMNRSGLEMLQADSLDQVKGQDVCPMILSEYRPAFMELTRRIFQGESGTLLFEMIGIKGRRLWLETRAVPLRNEKNEIIALLGVTRDVTEKKRVEEAVRQQADLLNLTRDAIIVRDTSDAITFWNRGAEQRYGWTSSEAAGQIAHKLLKTRFPRPLPEITRKLHDQGFWDGELVHSTRDGRCLNVSSRWSVRRDREGRTLGILEINSDITERKQAEDALRENQQRLDLALQSAHMGVWRWEIGENKRYFDDLTFQLLGIEATTFDGTAEEFFHAVHPEDREKIRAAQTRTLEQGTSYHPEYRVVWPDGSVRHIMSRGRLIRDDKGQPARINGILWDITERRLLEEERLKTQKLESIGTLAGGIAHDFNNLLQGIFGYISMAKMTHDQREKSLAMLEQAEKALHQSVNLTSQLLTFSKGGKPLKKVISLGPVIENSVKFALSGSSVIAELTIADDLRPVDADEGQIGQVIQNIVLNADQSMPLGGRIAISARNVPASSVTGCEATSGGCVEISISDQGTGIPPEHLQRIFDPYFTTKEKGSGLGLATSYAVIRNHGGVVTVASELGKGTLFTVTLPASAAGPEQAAPASVAASGRRGRVLLMDDEALIREVAGELLRAIGQEVVFAECGEVAIAAYQEAMAKGRPFDAVILDLTIRGGMGGVETVRRLLEIDPAVKAIVSSGYSDDAAISSYREKGFQAVLNKPYTVEGLHAVLNELMSAP